MTTDTEAIKSRAEEPQSNISFQWAFVGPVLECGQIAGLNGRLPDAIDVFNHAGNLWVGAGAAIASEMLPTRRSVRTMIAMGATALVNCTVETKWGVQHLPIAETLGGTTTDILDTIYSVGIAGFLSAFISRKP